MRRLQGRARAPWGPEAGSPGAPPDRGRRPPDPALLQPRKAAEAGAEERHARPAGQGGGRLYLFQGKRCAICARATGATRNLSVDHDHKTGLTRGLLCRPCNDFLGWVRDDPEAGRRLFQYLTNTPAMRLGIRAVHKDNRGEENG